VLAGGRAVIGRVSAAIDGAIGIGIGIGIVINGAIGIDGAIGIAIGIGTDDGSGIAVWPLMVVVMGVGLKPGILALVGRPLLDDGEGGSSDGGAASVVACSDSDAELRCDLRCERGEADGSPVARVKGAGTMGANVGAGGGNGLMVSSGGG